MPALNLAKEQGKRAVCLSNLKQLTLAWSVYADENDDKIVNGGVGHGPPYNTSWGHARERAWVLICYAPGWANGEQLPVNEQKDGIRGGALWPYAKQVKLYRCPTGFGGEMLTYAIMFSMNGVRHTDVEPSAFIKKRSKITNPAPVERLVFIDEGWISPDAFAVHYGGEERWWDDPPVRHGDGTNGSFADGHCEYWKWKGEDTKKRGRSVVRGHSGDFTPTTADGFQDLYRMQKATWGKLGYTPTH
jgi:prepilin-type processing-associated H-X9-DG protein